MDNPFKGLSKNGKIAVVIGGVGVAWFAWKQHKAGSGSASAQSIDPVTGLPYSQDNQIDPLTGQTYLGEAQTYGSVQAAENAVAGQSSIDFSNAAGGGGFGPVGSSGQALVPANTVQGTTYASNAAWAQAAEAGLTDIGYTSTDVAAALGRYLAGLSLTPAQATIVQAAIAEFGPPPVGSFQVIMAPGTGPTGSGDGGGILGGGSGGGGILGGGGGGTTPPPAKGGPITVTPVGLHVTHTYANSAQVAWVAPTIPKGQGPLTGYGCACYDSSGRLVNGPFTVGPSQLYANFGGLKPKTTYHANIWCDPAKPGGPHASIPFKTT